MLQDPQGWTVGIANDDFHASMVGVMRHSHVETESQNYQFAALTLRQSPRSWVCLDGGGVYAGGPGADTWGANAIFVALVLSYRDDESHITLLDGQSVGMADVQANISAGRWTWRVMADEDDELLVIVYTEEVESAPQELTSDLAADRAIAVTYGVAERKLISPLDDGIRLASEICRIRNALLQN